jgi:ubiquinone/menaquinone biosynthesis C-methylase UbiE
MNLKSKNPNTSILWDRLLFERDAELLRSPYYVDKINRVYRFLKNGKGKFLDIGFGTGNLERKILSKDTALEIYGIDFSKKAVANAKKQFRGNFYVARLQKLPFENSFFDFIVMLDVLEHIPKSEAKKVLDGINKVIKKNGSLVISVPLNENLKEMNREGTNFNMHLRQYTPSIIEKELGLSGFRVIRKEFIFAFNKYYFLKNVIMKIFPNIRKPNLLLIFARKR